MSEPRVEGSAPPFRLYLITDRRLFGGDVEALLACVEAVLAAVPRGAVAVQLRERDLDGRDYLALAGQARAITRSAGAQLFVSDRVDIARAAAADGVHLPSDGFSPRDVRAFWPDGRVGVSAHGLGDLARACAAGADFAVYGPVYAPKSKSSLTTPLGVAGLAEGASSTPLPLYALGGLDAERAPAALAAGARGVACIGAILGDAAPASAALAILDAMAAVR